MKTLRFEDNHQDFLEWDVDDHGKVVDSRPFQADVWRGTRVLDHADLRKGDKLLMRCAGIRGVMQLKHRIRSIKHHPQPATAAKG